MKQKLSGSEKEKEVQEKEFSHTIFFVSLSVFKIYTIHSYALAVAGEECTTSWKNVCIRGYHATHII